VSLVTTPGESRDRLSQFVYTTLEPGNPLGKLQEALELTREHAPLEKRLRQAYKEGLIASEYLGLQIGEAEKAQVISKAEANSLRNFHDKVAALLDVDDFAPEDFLSGGGTRTPEPAPKKTPRKKASKKPAAKKKTSRKKTAKKKTSKA
jgi:acyl-CoA dehydrogenase